MLDQIENLVIEGGGVRVCSVGGSLIALDKCGVLKQIKRYAGASAGAITCAGLAIGFTGHEIAKILLDTPFEKFKDDNFGYIRDAWRLGTQWGLYKGDYFHNWISDLIEKKTGDRNYSFRQLYDDSGKELILVTTNVNKDRPYYMSRYTRPDMTIALAVRMSMSVPFFFVPVKYEDDYYVDGGVSDNYPISVFDGHYPYQMSSTAYKKSNPKTLGLKLMGEGEQRDARIFHGNTDINNIVGFSSALVTHLMNRIERMGVYDSTYWDRTITVPTGTIRMLDFDITRAKKIEAQDVAYASAMKQLTKLTTVIKSLL
jgi:predicted acylesterase/phospholipase RssA